MNLIYDMACHLQAQGAGTIGRDLFLSRFPASAPDGAISLYEYAGEPVNRMDRKFASLRLQVICRAPDYDVALVKAQQVAEILQHIGNTDLGVPALEINGTRYFQLFALQYPFPLKDDEQDRMYFAQNYCVYAKPIEEKER